MISTYLDRTGHVLLKYVGISDLSLTVDELRSKYVKSEPKNVKSSTERNRKSIANYMNRTGHVLLKYVGISDISLTVDELRSKYVKSEPKNVKSSTERNS